MAELESELSPDEYEKRLHDLARHTLVIMVSEGADYTEPWDVHEHILMEFYEKYPVTVLEHASVDPTDRGVLGLLEGRPVKDPLEELVDHAQAVLATDVTRYIDRSLIEDTELVDIPPDAADPVENASLTDQGRSLLR